MTQLASPEKIRVALLVLPAFLRQEFEPEAVCTAVYGGGSNLHPDLCYRDMRVGIGWIEKFIGDSLDQRIVMPGNSDLGFTVPNGRLEIVFCHEGDIHSGGTDVELQRKLWIFPPFTGFVAKVKFHLFFRAVDGRVRPKSTMQDQLAKLIP